MKVPGKSLVLAASLLVLAGCGSEESFWDEPRSEEEWMKHMRDDGEESHGATACADGTEIIYWSPEGWGVAGEQPHNRDPFTDPAYLEAIECGANP